MIETITNVLLIVIIVQLAKLQQTLDGRDNDTPPT